MIGFSDRVDLGEVGVRFATCRAPGASLRSWMIFPSRDRRLLTLRLRGTAFDKYDGRRWERTQSKASHRRCQEHRDARDRALPRSVARPPKITIELEPIEPTGRVSPRAPSRSSFRTQQHAIVGEPLELSQRTRGRGSLLRRGAHGLRYDAFIATRSRADRRGAVRRRIAVATSSSRPTRPTASHSSRTSGRTRSRRATSRPRRSRSTSNTTSSYAARLAVRREAAARRSLPLRVEARSLRVLLDRDGDHAPRDRHPVAQRHAASSAERTTASATTTRFDRATRTRGSRRTSTIRSAAG